MHYRREIDGLRAVSLISVMLFHAGFKTFSGGFVGVDVFFVISGYLITTIMLTQHAQGAFSLLHFYQRRARRILPALFAMLIICSPLAWMILLPSQFDEFYKSALSALAFSSNIFFWQHSGYFDMAAELKPLLHTWSLALEEQYYLLFPIFMLFLWRLCKKQMIWILVALAILSLMLSQWGVVSKPVASFFLLPTRGWELLIGVFTAYYLLNDDHRNALPVVATELLSLLGLSLIIFSVCFFGKETPFPGWHALIPTLGAALIILYATPQTMVGKCLGLSWFVGIGLISYSAYLWHYPLYAFARHYLIDEPNSLVFLALAALSLLIGYLSWRFIETPFRRKGWINLRPLFIILVSAACVLLLLAPIVSRNKQMIAMMDERLRPNYGLDQSCDGGFNLPACKTSNEPTVIVWGDSYAMHLVPGLIASNPGIKMIQMTKSNCPPLFESSDKQFSENCFEFNQQVKEWLLTQHRIHSAVISANFFHYLSPKMEAAFDSTLAMLTFLGITPIIVSPLPENGKDIGACLANATRQKKPLNLCNIKKSEILDEGKLVSVFLKRLEKQYNVFWFDELLCDETMCKSHLGSVFIYRDAGHLSYEGSEKLGIELVTHPNHNRNVGI